MNQTEQKEKGNSIGRFFWTNKRRRAKNIYFLLMVTVVVFAVGIAYVSAKLTQITYEEKEDPQQPDVTYQDVIYDEDEYEIMQSIDSAGSLNDYLKKWANNGGTPMKSKNWQQ